MKMPTSFIKNEGQVDERVKFYGRQGPASFFFTKNEVVYSFVRREEEASLRKAMGRYPLGILPKSRLTQEGNSVQRRKGEEDRVGHGHALTEGHVVRLQFVGTNGDPLIEGQHKQPGKVNYFIGNDPTRWKKGLHTYGQVRYRELWPGIDLIYRWERGQLKYEFVVKPGANPFRILFAYRGIEGLALSDAGDLILKTPYGGGSCMIAGRLPTNR